MLFQLPSFLKCVLCCLCSHGRLHTTPISKNGFKFIGFPSILSHRAPVNATYPHSAVDDTLSELELRFYTKKWSWETSVVRVVKDLYVEKLVYHEGAHVNCNSKKRAFSLLFLSFALFAFRQEG